jgi:DNA-binding response OmpR family regulator
MVTAHSDILLVDDEAALRDSMRAALEAAGFSVETAANGIEMRAAIATRRFDLVVLDALLPGERGLDLAGLAMRHGLHVLMMTGDSFTLDGVVGLEYPILPKPFHLSRLVECVEGILRPQPRG